jgi:hypothetical protein
LDGLKEHGNLGPVEKMKLYDGQLKHAALNDEKAPLARGLSVPSGGWYYLPARRVQLDYSLPRRTPKLTNVTAMPRPVSTATTIRSGGRIGAPCRGFREEAPVQRGLLAFAARTLGTTSADPRMDARGLARLPLEEPDEGPVDERQDPERPEMMNPAMNAPLGARA